MFTRRKKKKRFRTATMISIREQSINQKFILVGALIWIDHKSRDVE